MDPNVALDILRRWAVDPMGQDPEETLDRAEMAAEAFMALDSWLTTQRGLGPREWPFAT